MDVLGSAGGGEVGLGDLVVGGGEADFESFGFTGPAFAFGFGDAGVEVVADFFQSVPLGGVDAEEGAPDARAGVLVDAWCRVGASAVAQGELAVLEVAEELVPFGVGGRTVFFAGPGGPALGDEGPVAADGFLGVGGLLTAQSDIGTVGIARSWRLMRIMLALVAVPVGG